MQELNCGCREFTGIQVCAGPAVRGSYAVLQGGIMAQNFVSLTEIGRTMKGENGSALSDGGCGAEGGTACGLAAGADDLPPEIWQKIQDHPCYSEDAHHYFARMHAAVAPACNIQCNYCNRKYDCSNESRPGVVSEKLTPETALKKVLAVAAEVPQLSVLGIAGPGDALAAGAENTFRTFELVNQAMPHLKLCLSTNGLALPDYVDRIAQYNISHVTITINMVDPEVGAKIYPWIFFNHKRYTGIEASQILHERQMLGLEMLTAKGILVKVNSVLIPGINDKHLSIVNAEVKKRGAFLHNIMPLISMPEHGTYFGLNGQRGPTPDELKAVQDKLSGGAKLMRHCRQCRADAVGLLGEDRGSEFTLEKLQEKTVPAYDPAARETYLELVKQERADRSEAKKSAEVALQAKVLAQPKLVAIATKGGGRINEHFGHAREFQIYEVDHTGARFIGHRRVDAYCLGGMGEADTLENTIKALSGVSGLLCAKIGGGPKEKLAAAGIDATDAYGFSYIESAAAAWYLAASRQAAAEKRA